MITEEQRSDLIQRIYDTLISNPDFGLGEMGSCLDDATRIVDEWIESNKIKV